MTRKIWECKIGSININLLPDSADNPMRRAVEKAFLSTVKKESDFCFSGWGGQITESELAAIECREPCAIKSAIELIEQFEIVNEGISKINRHKINVIIKELKEIILIEKLTYGFK